MKLREPGLNVNPQGFICAQMFWFAFRINFDALSCGKAIKLVTHATNTRLNSFGKIC